MNTVFIGGSRNLTRFNPVIEERLPARCPRLLGQVSESSSSRYQETAVKTLMDLRELAAITGESAEFAGKLEGLIELRHRKSAFMQRMRDACLA